MLSRRFSLSLVVFCLLLEHANALGLAPSATEPAKAISLVVFPSLYLPSNTAQGEATFTDAKSKATIKTVIAKDACFDQYFSLYDVKDVLQVKVDLVDCVANGSLLTYYPNGKLRVDSKIKDGLLEGETKTYNEQGELVETQLFHQGLPSDYVKASNLAEGKSKGREFARIEADLSTKHIDGPHRVKKAEVDIDFYVKNGCIDRYMRNYYDNGFIKSDIPVSQCAVNGTMREYDQQGFLYRRTNYQNSLKHGVATLYQSDATIEERYEHGYLVSKKIILKSPAYLFKFSRFGSQ